MISIIFLLIFLPSALSTCVNQAICGPGCWNITGTCAPVGLGYFSPADSNTRLPCEPGFYSNVIESSTCIPCRPGSITGLFASANCFLCPPGYYSGAYGQAFCRSCETPLYAGFGSNIVDETNNCLLVVLTNAPSSLAPLMTISQSPLSLSPTKTPTFIPDTLSPTPVAVIKSMMPTPQSPPSSAPTRYASSMGPTTFVSSPLSSAPTIATTKRPSLSPTIVPTKNSMTITPIQAPTNDLTRNPTTIAPIATPTSDPTTIAPIVAPTSDPTKRNPATIAPIGTPTSDPTNNPTTILFVTTQPSMAVISLIPSVESGNLVASKSPFTEVLISNAPSFSFTTAPSDDMVGAVPSLLPSMKVSLSPSAIAFSYMPSISLNISIRTVDEREVIPFYKAVECNDATLVLHGECRQCLTDGRFWILQFGFLAILLLLAVLVQFCCAGTIFAGYDFLFALSMFGMTSVPWGSTVERAFIFTSILSLDLNAILPLSCFPKIDIPSTRAIILCVPFLLWVVHGLVIPTIHGMGFLRSKPRYWICNRMGQWYLLILLFIFPYLMFTTLEAAECDNLGWFCFRDGKPRDYFILSWCVAAAVILGSSILFLSCQLRMNDDDNTLFSTYRRWWWQIMVLIRKLVMVVLIYFFLDWSIIGLLVIGIINLGLHFLFCPYNQDDSSRGLQGIATNQVLDFFLQCLMVIVGVLGVSLERYPNSATMCSNFVLIFIGMGLIFWLFVILKNICCTMLRIFGIGKDDSETHETDSSTEVKQNVAGGGWNCGAC